MLGILALAALPVTLLWDSFDSLHPKRLFINHIVEYSPNGLSSAQSVVVSSPDPLPISLALPQLKGEYYADLLGYWDPLFPFAVALHGEKAEIPSHLQLSAPELNRSAPPLHIALVKKSEGAESTTYHFVMNYKGYEWCMIRISETNLVEWSISPKLPSPVKNSHVVRHVGGRGVDEWTFWLKMKKGEKVEIHASALHFVSTKALENVIRQIPEWTTPTELLSTFQVFTF
jgi:hypothetical protein